MRRLVNWFKALSAGGKAGIILAAFIGIGIVGAAGQNPSNSQPTKPATPHTSTAGKPTVGTKSATSTKPIPFATTSVQDTTLAQGTTKVTTQGVNGVETLTYQDTYTDGKLTAHKLTSDLVTTQPVTQVTSVGTYVAPTCTNGSYVNSAGNTVCSPGTNPNGATAQCVDGSYSYSQSRSGTCSHHGGVAQWL